MPSHIKMPEEIAENPICSQIWNNVYRKNMNQTILVVGRPRSGKTSICLSLSELLDRNNKGEPSFSIDNVCPSISDLIKKTDGNDRRGECFVWEEAGTIMGANARQFKSFTNLIGSSLFQILGFKGQIVFVNLPMNFMLDKQIRSLFHIIIIAKYVDIKGKAVIAKVKWNDVNPETNKFYGKYTTYFVENRLRKATRVRIEFCSRELWSPYRKLEKEFKRKMMGTFTKNLRSIEEDDSKIRVRFPFREVLNKVCSLPHLYWDYVHNKPNIPAIRLFQDGDLDVQSVSLANATHIAQQWRMNPPTKSLESAINV